MNSEEFYREMLKEYTKNDRRDLLRETYSARNLKDFKTYVHGVKSTSANIGAKSVSEKAKRLEQAAGEEDIQYITDNYNDFMNEYEALIEHIIKEEG